MFNPRPAAYLAATLLSGVLAGAGHAQVAASAPAASPHYELEVALDPAAHRLRARGILRLPAATASRDTVELRLRAEFDSLQVEVLSPALSAGRATLTRRVADGRTPTWIVAPRAPFPPNEPVRLRFSYAGGETPGFLLYLGEEGSFAGATWYPKWGDGTGTGTLRFQAPRGFTVVSTGRGDGGVDEGQAGVFSFVVDRPAEFAFAAARYYVDHVGGARPITVYSLKRRTNVNTLAQRLGEVVDALVEEFGPLPGGAFSLVEAPAAQAGAAGFDGASLDGFILSTETYLEEPFNMGFFAHEVGHQWWGIAVRHRGERGKYLLDEAMAQYGALRVVEVLEGPAAARSFRRLGYPGMSFTHGLRGYAYLSQSGFDFPLDALPDTGFLAHVSHDVADGKGFLAHEVLARAVGRERFRAVLQRFVRDHAGEQVTWPQWKAAVERGAGRDLGTLWSQWYERSGLPQPTLEWTRAGRSVQGTIRQEDPAYDLELPVQVTFEGGAVTRNIRIRGESTPFRIRVPAPVLSVELDPENLVPRWDPALLGEARANAGGMRAYVFAMFRQDVASAQAELERMLHDVPEPDLYATRFGAHYLLGTLAFFGQDAATAKQQFARALASPTRSDDSLPWLYVRLAHIAQAEGDEPGMRRALADALSADAAAERTTGVASYIGRTFPAFRAAGVP